MGSLQSNWLSIEFDSIESEIEEWSSGLRESFQSLFAEESAPALQAEDELNSPLFASS